MFKLYKTWRRAKDMFVRPSLKIHFGKYWGHSVINIGSYKNKYMLKDTVLIHTGYTTLKYGDKEHEIKTYDWVPKHKLPRNLKAGQFVWNRNVRKKLRKLHLSWIPTSIIFPWWLRFKILNYDVGWKTKYSSIRYEFPPQLAFVAFGFALSFTLHCPVKNDYSYDDSYWESILYYIFGSKKIIDVIEQVGIRTRLSDNVSYFGTRPTYIKDDRLEEYFVATSKLKAKHLDKIIV